MEKEQGLEDVFRIRLREIREYRGWSMTELSKRTGGQLSQQFISKLESGDAKPSIHTINILVNTLGVKAGLLLEKDQPVPLNKQIDRFAPETQDYIINEAKESYITLAKEAQAEDIGEDDIKVVLNLIKKHK